MAAAPGARVDAIAVPRSYAHLARSCQADLQADFQLSLGDLTFAELSEAGHGPTTQTSSTSGQPGQPANWEAKLIKPGKAKHCYPNLAWMQVGLLPGWATFQTTVTSCQHRPKQRN